MELESRLLKISLDDVKLTNTLFFTIFMKRGDRFLPCVTEGSPFDEETKERLLAKGIKEVYIEDHVLKVHTNSKKNVAEEIDKKSVFIYETATDIMQNLLEKPSLENIQKSKDIVNNVLDEILKEEQVFSSLLKVTSYDYYTYSHSVNVSVYALGLGKHIGLGKNDLSALGQAAILHDIGKSKIDPAIINKNGKLTEEEFTTIKNHPLFGYEIASANKGIDPRILAGIRHHHEKMDGTGYPDRLQAKDIHMFAQIIAITDIFDALTTKRSYKEAMSTFDALKLMRDKMIKEINPKLFNRFIILMSE